jgi:hypothetical protein
MQQHKENYDSRKPARTALRRPSYMFTNTASKKEALSPTPHYVYANTTNTHKLSGHNASRPVHSAP